MSSERRRRQRGGGFGQCVNFKLARSDTTSSGKNQKATPERKSDSRVRNKVAEVFCTTLHQTHKHKSKWSRIKGARKKKYPVSRDFAPHKVNFKKLSARLTFAYCAFGAQTKLILNYH
jgi:hypothetical protein